MKKHSHSVKAEKLVSKAVGVFASAVVEIEKAQAILTEGVKADTAKVASLKNQLIATTLSTNKQIEVLTSHKAEKGKQMKANAELLAKLKEYQA